jgi:hypothetical protein
LQGRIKKYTILIIIFSTILFGNCVSTPLKSYDLNQRFIGSWTSEQTLTGRVYILEFKPDGTGFETRYINGNLDNVTTFKYSINDFKIFFYFDYDNHENIASYIFTDDDNILQLINWINGAPNEVYHKNDNNNIDNIEMIIAKSVSLLVNDIPDNAIIAVLNISSNDNRLSEYILDKIEYILFKNKYTIVDRKELDIIRNEQNFQLSGEVDDNSAVSIGKFSGASIIVLGNISGNGNIRRMRLRALDVQTGRVIGMSLESFK